MSNPTVSESQIDQMKHALGLNYSDKPTRNNYYTDANNAEWNDLVDKHLATKRSGWDDESAYFRVTEEGKKLLGVSINE